MSIILLLFTLFDSVCLFVLISLVSFPSGLLYHILTFLSSVLPVESTQRFTQITYCVISTYVSSPIQYCTRCHKPLHQHLCGLLVKFNSGAETHGVNTSICVNI